MMTTTGLPLGGGSETRALSPQPPLPILGEGESALLCMERDFCFIAGTPPPPRPILVEGESALLCTERDSSFIAGPPPSSSGSPEAFTSITNLTQEDLTWHA